MYNHRANMRFEVFMGTLKEAALAEGREIGEVCPPEALTEEAFFWYWVDDPTPATQTNSTLLSVLHHCDIALRARNRTNVVLMHYGDLKANCEAEMRRLAARLDIEVAEQKWSALVKAASFGSMRARAGEVVPNIDQSLWKEPRQFLHSGTGGHWRAFFDDAAQRRYEARVQALASPEVAAWAHFGRHGAPED
jgi:hypothetical protein